jgi:hypothetical protein
VQRQTIDCIQSRDDAGIGAGRRFVRGLGLAVARTVAEYMESNRDLLFGDRTGTAPLAAQ